MEFVREPATSIAEAADFYQSGAPGSKWGIAPRLTASDAEGPIIAKFDGVDATTGEMVDRKLNLGGSSIHLGLRQAATAEANGFGIRWEPNPSAQAAAQRIISTLGIKNIRVVVVPK